jgi:predicted dehydrogenase
MTVAACRAGKHISVQKPMARTVAEADRMIQAAEETGTVFRIYENFIFYEPFVRAKEMIEAGEIGEPQMIRLHLNTGTRDTGWKVPARANAWRYNKELCGGGPMVFDHGYHFFSVARHLMGEVKRVFGWIDEMPVSTIPASSDPASSGKAVDSPAAVIFQFKKPYRYGVLDYSYTPNMRIHSQYYADDERFEVIGDRGILFVNRCTSRSVDLPELMMFRDGKTTPIPVQGPEWHDSFIACTRHLIDVIKRGGDPVLNGETGKAVLQFALAAQISAATGREVQPDEVT